MSRTAFHEKLKQMRFEEAYEGFQEKRLSQDEADTFNRCHFAQLLQTLRRHGFEGKPLTLKLIKLRNEL